VEESLHQDGPLDHQGGHEQGESSGTVAVFAQEGHQEAKANEDHHLDVLELCGEIRRVRFQKEEEEEGLSWPAGMPINRVKSFQLTAQLSAAKSQLH